MTFNMNMSVLTREAIESLHDVETVKDEQRFNIDLKYGLDVTDYDSKSPWININDSLPNDETKLYIIYCEAYNKNGDDIKNKHYEIYLANFDKETSSWVNVESYNNYFFNVLYWMPIPELPK